MENINKLTQKRLPAARCGPYMSRPTGHSQIPLPMTPTAFVCALRNPRKLWNVSAHFILILGRSSIDRSSHQPPPSLAPAIHTARATQNETGLPASANIPAQFPLSSSQTTHTYTPEIFQPILIYLWITRTFRLSISGSDLNSDEMRMLV